MRGQIVIVDNTNVLETRWVHRHIETLRSPSTRCESSTYYDGGLPDESLAARCPRVPARKIGEMRARWEP